MTIHKVIFPLILMGLVLAACERSDQSPIVVSDVWGRPSPTSAANAAFYMSIHNNGQNPDSLERVEIDICDSAELHETNIDDDGVMRMDHIRKIDISDDETISLEPGGLHVMCLGLKSTLETGEEIPIKLSFANSGDKRVQAEIREQ